MNPEKPYSHDQRPKMTAANNPNYQHEKYTTIASNHLVVYAIYSLQNDGDEISAEDIISACFTLFPRKFSLRTYPQWPDSALIGRRLHDCEKNGWLTARIDTGFKLTALGNKLAEKVAKELGIEIPKKEKPKQVHKVQVDKLRVVEAKTVGELQVDKLQVTETAVPVGELQVGKPQVTEIAGPAPVAKPETVQPKTGEESKPPAVETPKPADKVVAPAVKAAPAKPKTVEKTKAAPAVKTPKPAEKKAAAPLAKPAPVKSKPAKKAKRKQVDKLQVAEAVKPGPAKPKIETVKEKRVVEVKATETVQPAPVKPKPAKETKKKQIDKLQVTKPPKPAQASKPAPAKPLKVEKVKEKQVDKLQVTKAVKPAPKATTTVHRPPSIVQVQKQVAKAVKPAPKATTTVHRPSSIVQVQKQVAEVAKPAPAKPAPAVKPEPAAKPKAKVVPPSIVHRQLSLLPTVSTEEKAKAGKFVKMMEGSDAYRLYKKNGANANIGEFDFRSLLLCTMESSHETLARNVDLFKGYAEIHNRQDLIAFLAVCRDKFAHLLTPEKKVVRKLK